jgi:hypothetical protein
MNLQEKGKSNEKLNIAQSTGILEKAFENAVWKIRKFANDEAVKNNKPYEVSSFKGNCLCNEGINEILTIIGSDSSGTKYDNTNAYLIVGTGDGAATADDTESDFTAGVVEGMESSYPTYGTSQKITWKASYGSDDANQAWNEFGVLNASTSGKLLNRKVSDQGTKTSGQTWELSLEITFS